jgi:hypothetical protein
MRRDPCTHHAFPKCFVKKPACVSLLNKYYDISAPMQIDPGEGFLRNALVRALLTDQPANEKSSQPHAHFVIKLLRRRLTNDTTTQV